MTEEQFCKNDTAYNGEEVNSLKQITLRSFNGDELKEYVEHHIKLAIDEGTNPKNWIENLVANEVNKKSKQREKTSR